MEKQKYLLVDYLFLCLAVSLFYFISLDGIPFQAEKQIIILSFLYNGFYFLYYPKDRLNCFLIFVAGISATLFPQLIAVPLLLFIPVILFMIHLRMKNLRLLEFLKNHSNFKAAHNIKFREILEAEEKISDFPGIKSKMTHDASNHFVKEDFKYKMKVTSDKNSVRITLLDKEQQKYYFSEQQPTVFFGKRKFNFQPF